jgi:hypothetical protein
MTGQDPAEARGARSAVSLSLVIRSEVAGTRALVSLIRVHLNLLAITDAPVGRKGGFVHWIDWAEKIAELEIIGKFLAV